jgi:hypothetical protein
MTAIKRAILGVMLAGFLCGGCSTLGEPLLVRTYTGLGTEPKAVELFSELEREASQCGFITAGAIRVAPYDLGGLKDLRQKLIQGIDEMTADIKAAPKPEMSAANLRATELLANLSLSYKGFPDFSKAEKPPETNQDLYKSLQGTLNDLFKASMQSNLDANRIDIIRLRLGYLKYLDAEYANLRLTETFPLDENKYRRVLVSVQLTALVRREEAQGAMVMMDLYPQHADTWAHYTGRALKNIVDAKEKTEAEAKTKAQKAKAEGELKGEPKAEEAAKNGKEPDPPEKPEDWNDDVECQFQIQWDKYLPLLQQSFFPGAKLRPFRMPSPEPMLDYEGWMHHYLISNGLLPRIIHVEPLDEGELFNQLDLETSSTRLATALGTILPKTEGVFTGAYGSTAASGEKSQLVNPLSLAFAAGSNRAGWVFLPSKAHADSPILRPTERRIRMVVDIPKGLSSVALHVHKVFTDESLRPIKAAPFDKQLRKLNQARYLLSESEEDFPKDFTQLHPRDAVRATNFKTTTNWELMKSRMRNILYEGWSEALSFEMLQEPPFSKIQDQTAVIDDDESQAIVTLRGGHGINLKKVQAYLKVPTFVKLEIDIPSKVVIPMGVTFYSFSEVEIARDDLKNSIKFTFPSLTKAGVLDKAFAQGIAMDIVYYGDDGKELTTNHLQTVHVPKKKEKIPGFAMTVATGQILADQNGRGQVRVKLEKAKTSPAQKMTLDVKGADVMLETGQTLEFKSDTSVILLLNNLSERTPVIISAKNEADAAVPTLSLRVDRIPLEQPKK